ncbi:MAG TPA: hypothetical protein PKE00_01685 [Planctomycetota bacterium]|mgnify:CR=1 FL=1|nr:hypothetical protein [Planctomycetota bacterium]
MINAIRRRPWLLVVFGLGFLVMLSLAFLVIAAMQPSDVLPIELR